MKSITSNCPDNVPEDEYIVAFGKKVSHDIVSHNIRCFIKEGIREGYIKNDNPLAMLEEYNKTCNK